MDEVASAVQLIKQRTGSSKVAVVGYSMGAEIALRLVVEHPDRVGSLVIGGSGWSGLADSENYQQLADSLEVSASFGPIVGAMTPPGQPEPTAEEIAAMDPMLEGQDIAALVSVARAMADIINLSTEEMFVWLLCLFVDDGCGAHAPFMNGTTEPKRLELALVHHSFP